VSHDTRDDLVSAQAVERYKERQKEGRETHPAREAGNLSSLRSESESHLTEEM